MTSPASGGPGRWPTLILLVATAVGVPSSLFVFKPEFVLQHPVTTCLYILLWELGLLIAGLVTDVWSKLRSRWVDRLADWVDHSLQALFSHYRRRYLDYLFYRHRDFDVKGLTTQSTYNLELEQVFVDLTIQPTPPGGTSANPIRPFPKELTGRRSIWDYLTSESFTDHLALIGAPGSGKTTLLKKIALQMTGRKRPKIRQNLPILLFLREHAETILATSPPSLADIASADLARKQSLVLPPAAWFRGKLETGRCLILLDGLDEVASQETRQKVVAWVETQITTFPRNRFLISSRPHGYKTYPVAGLSVLEIQPFNRDQVRQFVYNWYRANEIHSSGKLDPGVEIKAREGAEDLLRRLGNSQTLTDLAVNPLLLTMIATVHRFRSSLPGRRVELYAEICEVFLGKRQLARGVVSDLTPAQKQRVLQPLAYQLMRTNKREMFLKEVIQVVAESLKRVAGEKPGSPEADFLKNIENESGLLLERESGVFSFAHLAFQEYLTAVYIRETGLEKELVDKVTNPWWYEVVRLYGAQGDASGVLAACLAPINPSVSQLSLAIDCLEEAREVDPELRTKVESLVNQGAESLSPDWFRLATETMLARRLRDMVAIDENTFIDPNYISQSEYQLYIHERQAIGQYRQPDHWREPRFVHGQALTPVVGMRLTDAMDFCAWLNARNGTFTFRLPKPNEIERYHIRTSDTQGTAQGFWTTTGFERSIPIREQSLVDYIATLFKRDLFETTPLDFSSLPRDLEIPSHRAEQRVEEFIRMRDLVQKRVRYLDYDIRLNIPLNIDRMFMSDISSIMIENEELSIAIYRDLYGDPKDYSDPSMDRARKLYHKSTLDQGRFDRLFRRGRFRDYALAKENFSKLANQYASFIILSLARDVDVAKDIALVRSLAPNISKESRRNLRWILRIIALYLSTLVAKGLGTLEWSYSKVMRETWLPIYENLLLLEARIDEVIPAVEGIRIIKERRP